MSQVEGRLKRHRRWGKDLLIGALAVASLSLTLETTAMAAPDAVPAPNLTDACVGLMCNTPSTGFYVPEAQSETPTVADLDELRAQPSSGFYKMPAFVYNGTQSQSVVYLSKPGQHDRMPESVRRLENGQEATSIAQSTLGDTDTVVVLDVGLRLVIPAERAAPADRAKARAAMLPGCADRYFCVFYSEGWVDMRLEAHGPTWTGTGWHDLSHTFGSSMSNWREGDSLLAQGLLGGGPVANRYCARENSTDSTFSNNNIGNGNARSWALLRAADNRC